MHNQPIVTDVFSAVTVRSPQLLTEEEKERGFVYFPWLSVENSFFLGEFRELEDDKAVRCSFPTK